MALFGSNRDISFFRHVSKELLNRIIAQQILYYKLDLETLTEDIYGDAKIKNYYEPMLVSCLVQRNDQANTQEKYGPDTNRQIGFAFLRGALDEVDLVPEKGDIICWNEDYYEVDYYIENQLIGGKQPEYALQPDLQNFGSSWSIICMCHLTRQSNINIIESR